MASLPSMDSRTSGSADRGAELRMLAALLVLALAWVFLPRDVDARTGDPVLLNEALVSHTGDLDAP